MCGIVGIVESKGNNVVNDTIDSLQQLEYRGYDSAGITIINNKKFRTTKSVGKIKNLKGKIKDDFVSNIAIAHTRWATHGVVNEANAHPHTSCRDDITIVHNGIIENYNSLKSGLSKEKYTFNSETDSEVIGNLISYNLQSNKNMFESFIKSIKELEGSYAIAAIHNEEPDKIFVAKNNSPLVIGVGNGKNLIASSVVALSKTTDKIIQLNDKQVAIVSADKVELFDINGKKVTPKIEVVKINDMKADKGKFDHFMLKEIYEQPEVLERTIEEYIDKKNKKIIFPNIDFDLSKINHLTIVACGTSYHAGCIAKYFIEELADIPVNVDIASEFRYRANPLEDNGLAVFISQSGETADTLAALRYCKAKKQKILSIVNVVQSAIANESDIVLKTLAGVEVGVCSTKAFAAQIFVLYLLALEIAKSRNKISKSEYQKKIVDFIDSIRVLKYSLENKSVDSVKKVAKEICNSNFLMYIGRDLFYPMALEGALKIKEISYIPTQGIASGELKHGTIALVDENSYIVALNNTNLLFDKNLSSIEEITARKGKVILICDDNKKDNIDKKIHSFIETEKVKDKFGIVLSTLIPLQLLAYYVAVYKKLDVDKPRNLAKSVTVE